MIIGLGFGAIAAISCQESRSESPPQTTILRVANWEGPSVDAGFLLQERSLREEFERRHPGVRIKIENIPGEGQYVPKLLMMFVAKRAPDVLQLDASYASVFIDNDLLLDMTPIIESDTSFELDRYFRNVVDVARRGDALYAIPLDFTPLVLFYNKRLFDEANIPYPNRDWTCDEFLEVARALTIDPPGDASKKQYGLYFRNLMSLWVPWIWANGGSVLSPDGQHAEGYFNSEQSITAIRFLTDMITQSHVAPSDSEAAAAGVDLFQVGRAAMNVAGHWMIIDYRTANVDFGVTMLPSNTGRPRTVIYESGLAINRETKQQTLAWEYVKFMTSAEVQKIRVSSGLAISAQKDVAEYYASDEQEQTFLEAVEYASGPRGARVEPYAVIEDLGREVVENIVNGMPVRAAINQAAQLMERELSQQ
ncbi:MAG TPA: sugar ABC transporter substrate-binding protein [Phycisphaerae bacterium]|nr:sugar ABC transporter substrate-binding protein [Phycisphaerae bacterium]HRW52271.1 sugar ABC transporter substrate-binding protein [Phycisphaerae bacterium]